MTYFLSIIRNYYPIIELPSHKPDFYQCLIIITLMGELSYHKPARSVISPTCFHPKKQEFYEEIELKQLVLLTQ